jgi:CRP-like cAMP-binding protein
VLAYLARYTHQVAISNSRLTSADQTGATFKWRDYWIEGPGRYKTMTLQYTGLMTTGSPELKAFLVATPFFGGLSDASLDLLISMLVERRFDVGATVVAEGEPGGSMFIVHSGELVVGKLGGAGRVIRMAGLTPGDFFGEMTLVEMQNRSATVVAECPTVLYELTARNLYTYYKSDIYAYVMVMQNINRELCRRLRRADNRITELAEASREATRIGTDRPRLKAN